MKQLFNISVLCILLGAGSLAAQAEVNLGFSIAGTQVTDENYYQIGNVLKWTNLVQSGDVSYDADTHTLTLDNAYIRYPFGIGGIRNDSCQNLTIVVKGACTLHSAIFDAGYSALSTRRETHVVGTPADTLYILGGDGTWVTKEYDENANLYFDSLTVDFDIHMGNCFSGAQGAKNYINGATIIAHQFAIAHYGGFGTGSLVFSEGWGFVYPVGVYYDEEQGIWVDKDGNLIVSKFYGYKHLPNPIQVIIRSLDDPFKESNVWIAKEQINELNCKDVRGDGTISYDFDTKTLLLSDATIEGSGPATGTVTERGVGIYSEEPGLTINVQGTNTISGDTDNQALWFYGKCNPLITGDGTLKLNSNIEALYDSGTLDTLTIGGEVTVEADGGIAGMYRFRANNQIWYNSLRIKDNATVKAYRDSSSGLYHWDNLILEDDHAITTPQGAYWDANKHLPVNADGSDITGGWVTIARVEVPRDPYDLNGDGSVDVSDVTLLVAAVLDEGAAPAAYDLNGDTGVDIGDVTELVSAVLAQ